MAAPVPVPVDDLVALAASLNDGPGRAVYTDVRDEIKALSAKPWTCPHCGGENDAAFAFCPGCATPKP